MQYEREMVVEDLRAKSQERDVLFGELSAQCDAIEKSLTVLEDVIRPCLREADPAPNLQEVCKDPEVRSEVAQFGTRMGVRLDILLAQIASIRDRVEWG